MKLLRAGSVRAEALESRTLMSVTQDADGWTVVTPETHSRVIYVSTSTGDDDNGGRSEGEPVRSIAKGLSLIRNNSGDQLLLKRGDVWTETFGGGWGKSGISEQEPILIGAYGEGARPRLNTGSVEAFNAAGGKDDRVDHIVIQGIHLSAHTRLPGAQGFVRTTGNCGIRVLVPSDNIIVEDCYIEGYRNNIILQSYYGDITDFTVRRSVIVDAYSLGGVHAQGLYATGVKGLTLEENVFDHNGWNETVDGAGQTSFNHNVYLQADNEDVVVRGNVFANGSSHGLHARAGGEVTDNLFLDNAIGMSFGLVNGAPAKPGGVSGKVAGNVFLGARRIEDEPRGWGLEVGNTKAGAGVVVSDNVFAGGGEDARNPAIVLGVGSDMLNTSQTVGINDLTVEQNIIYDWSGGIRLTWNLKPGDDGPSGLHGLLVRGNDFQNLEGKAVLHDMRFDEDVEAWTGNRYQDDPGFSIENDGVSPGSWRRDRERDAEVTDVDYPDPERDAATYSASLGGAGTTEAFVEEARLQSKQRWRPHYTGGAAAAYVKAGFFQDVVSPPPSGPPEEPAEPGPTPPVERPAPPPPAPAPPVPPVAAADVLAAVRVNARADALEVTVRYTDHDADIDNASLDTGDLHLLGPGGFDQPAELLTLRDEGAATVVTYAVAAPAGAWSGPRKTRPRSQGGRAVMSDVFGTLWIERVAA